MVTCVPGCTVTVSKLFGTKRMPINRVAKSVGVKSQRRGFPTFFKFRAFLIIGRLLTYSEDSITTTPITLNTQNRRECRTCYDEERWHSYSVISSFVHHRLGMLEKRASVCEKKLVYILLNSQKHQIAFVDFIIPTSYILWAFNIV